MAPMKAFVAAALMGVVMAVPFEERQAGCQTVWFVTFLHLFLHPH